MDSSDQGEDSFVVELLNAKERHGDGTRQSRNFVATPPNGGTAAMDDFPGWDDGGEYARAAEAAGVDVGGMLEAGVDAKQLLEFVSNYRRQEGDKLGLLDEQNLKFATSRVLREGPRAAADAVRTQFAGDRRSQGTPAEGAPAWEFAVRGEKGRDERGPREAPNRVTAREPLQPRNGTSPNPDPRFPVARRERREVAGAGASSSPRNRTTKNVRHAAGRPSGRPSASGRPSFGEDDRAETARLCDELLRWSSALEGAERRLGGGNGGAAGVTDDGSGGGGARARPVASVPVDDTIKEGSERSTSTRENFHLEGFRSDEGGATYRNTPNEPGRYYAARGEEARAREHDRRCSRRQAGDAKVDGSGRDRSRSVEDAYDVDVEDVDVGVGGWEGGDLGPASSPLRRRAGGIRRSTPNNGSGRERPMPSYALPTKHFKTTSERSRRHLLYAEDAEGQKQIQRQAHLEDENAALKLRLEGQRRAIHELEHQANILREDARLREEELSRLKARVARSSSVSGGKCSCCASTHHARARATGDNGPSALKKRALAAEGRSQTLERCLNESKAKDQRSREIVASLKHSYSGAQAKITGLESELESARKSLSEARRELAESRRDAKGRVKETRKHRRQQGEKEREAENARTEAADLASQLRKASREAERARLEAAELREEKARAESESKDLTRENRMLQDRLNDGNLRSRIRERDRWILAELRSESRSPPRRGPPKEPRAVAGRQRAPSADFRARLSKGGPRGRRRLRVDDACPDSTSGSEPSTGSRAGSRSPSAAVRRQDHDGGSRGRLPPRNGRRGESTRGWAGGASESGAERRLSTRSADGTAEDVLGDAAVLRGSTLSGGSARSSTMGARYERLQAMYRRVNRRDGGTRGRAGVG